MPGFTGTLTFQCAGAPLAATCLVPPSMSVTSGTKLPLTVTISTTGAAAELIPRQPLHWLPSFFQVGRVLCLLFALFAAVYATGRCDRDGVVRVLSPAATLAACLLVVALPLTGCGGAAATAQSTPVTQSLTTPSGTSKIVLQPSAAAANGKPIGTIVPIELTLTVQ